MPGKRIPELGRFIFTRTSVFPRWILAFGLLIGSLSFVNNFNLDARVLEQHDAYQSADNLRDFVPAAPQGFGDRQNGWAWAMAWWNGHLYVGTNRAFHCVEIAALHRVFPALFPYPPADPDLECAANPENLPIQAEIWRWIPASNTWQRVYQSPMDILIPGSDNKYVARDIGFRGMSVFEEPDGTEGFYVAGVGPGFLWPDMPKPRLLRSVDGVNFAPVPQEPGTFLGDFPFASLRNQISFQDRFFVVGGTIQGSGTLLEAENPAGGNDEFQIVSTGDQVVSAVQVYNDHLYVGLRSFLGGYAVEKTAATGSVPYTYTTIVEQGGYLSGLKSSEVLSMQVFNDRLYVGSNGLILGAIGLMVPAEVIRINPDDSWDVVVGDARATPDGWKYPISGFDAGFGNFFNGHMWRMAAHAGNLFIGTFDSSTTFKDDPNFSPSFAEGMGFDLYRTPNGVDFFPITLTGFNDKFNFGVRSMESTPYGLFLGTANYWYGLQIWRLPVGSTGQQTIPPVRETLYLPVLSQGMPVRFASSPTGGDYVGASSPLGPPPSRVESEAIGDAYVISWDPQLPAHSYRIMRATVETVEVPVDATFVGPIEEPAALEEMEPMVMSNETQTLHTTVWSTPIEVGHTTDFWFVDDSVAPGGRYVYYVEARDHGGRYSSPSNLYPAPSAAPPMTFTRLLDIIKTDDQYGAIGFHIDRHGEMTLTEALSEAQTAARRPQRDFARSSAILAELRSELTSPTQALLPAWKAEDLARHLARLERRVRLAAAGVLDLSGL